MTLILLLAALPSPSLAAPANPVAQQRSDGGPKPSETKVPPAEPWREMNYGPFLTATIEASQPKGNLTMKGLMICLDANSKTYALFDTDLLRFSAVWTGGTINWNNILFDGKHGKHSSIVGTQLFANPPKPGWAKGGNFDDPRALPYGPLAHDNARYRGLYLQGNQVILSYKVGDTGVLELPGGETGQGLWAFTRTLEIDPSAIPLLLQVCAQEGFSNSLLNAKSLRAVAAGFATSGNLALLSSDASPEITAVACVGALTGDQFALDGAGNIRLKLAPASKTARRKLLLWHGTKADLPKFAAMAARSAAPQNLQSLTRGGPPRWPEKLVTKGEAGKNNAAYVIDQLTAPTDNPWKARMRFGGFDFFEGGRRAAICTWDGDVWVIDGLDDSLAQLSWQRIATGLFQPLGVKIVRGEIYVCGRDQITRLHDLNGDGETDFYETFNNDHEVTDHFHEFAMDLQTDPAGNFYYAKGGRHGLDSVVPQHGTLLKVSPDGKTTEFVCNGFRAPNGVGFSPKGEIAVSDQEGHWTPANRINLVQPGGFYGYMWSYHRGPRPTTYDPPLCWIWPKTDRSPAEQLWVTSDKWGPFNGQMISSSYGMGAIYLVPYEMVNGIPQGGVVKFPLDFPTGVMRARFHPRDGQLYLCGLFGWSSNKSMPGGFYRIRYTGQKVYMPKDFHAEQQGIAITFAEPLDKASAEDFGNYAIEQWNYDYHEAYGSKDYKPSQPGQIGHDAVEVESATLLEDGRTVFLAIKDLKPVMQMQLQISLKAADGKPIQSTIFNTINAIGPDRLVPKNLPKGAGIGRVNKTAESRFLPGVNVRFTSTSQPEFLDARRDRMIALQVQAGDPASSLLKPGPFSAAFDGLLRTPLSSEFKFSVRGNGRVKLTINGELVLSGEGELSEIPPVHASLRQGYNRIDLHYDSPTNAAAAVRLYWEGNDFKAEPVPPANLFCNPDGLVRTRESLRLGRELFAECNCAKCHQVPIKKGEDALVPELQRDVPSLAGVGSRLTRDWIFHWLLDPERVRSQVTMPRLLHESGGTANRQVAADLAEYLGTLTSGDATQPKLENSVTEGQALFSSLGCVGCHTLDMPGRKDAEGRTSLHFVNAKFQPGALKEFLRAPARHYAWTRMPDFQLTEIEASALASYLGANATGRLAQVTELSHADPRRGAALFSELRCANCHSVTDLPGNTEKLAVKIFKNPRSAGCLGEPNTSAAPDFRFSSAEQQALLAFLGTGGDSLKQDAPTEFAERAIAALNCTVCHNHDGQNSRWQSDERLQAANQEDEPGKSVPAPVPSLTWAGEKLKGPWLQRLFAGELPARSRPWMKQRMPVFASRSAFLARGLAAEHGVAWNTSVEPSPDAKLAGIGHRLTLAENGFNCIQCHGVGAQAPVAAFDNQGVNFVMVKDRLRYEYYQRWVLNPLRVEPGSKMPQFSADQTTTPITTVLGGDARKQFDAIWHYLQTVPDNPQKSSP